MSVPTADELDAQARTLADWLWQHLLRTFALIRAGLVVSGLERWLLARNVEAAVRAVGLDRLDTALTQVAAQALTPLREAGFQGALDGMPEVLQVTLGRQTLAQAARFDPVFWQAIQRQDLTRIQGITQETEDAVRSIIREGLTAGTPTGQLAAQIKAQVGLNTRQVAAVAKYRALLERQGRDPAQVERMVAKYTTRQLKLRAQTIAITETMQAQNDGRRLRWQQMVDAGTLVADEWEVEWLTAHDERVCPICGPLDGERVPIGGQFDTDVGELSGPPAHPRCRCIVRLQPFGFRKGEPTAPARDAILKRLGVLG